MAVPNHNDFRRAWEEYRKTWANGLRGEEKENEVMSQGKDPKDHFNDAKENLARNSNIVREDAQQLAEQLSRKTGIRNKDDLRNMATEIMKLATDCLKEFMSGYRNARDEEVEKMMNEYFQEDEEEDKQSVEKTATKRRRKPKHAIIRR